LDAQDLYSRFTMDAASEFLFGKNLDTLTYGREDVDSFAKAFEDIQQVIVNRGAMGRIWPLFDIFYDKALPYADAIRRWLDPIMQQVLEHKKNTKRTGRGSDVNQSSFLEYLADSSDGKFSSDLIVNLLRTIFPKI
jgi:Cytochrome P450